MPSSATCDKLLKPEKVHRGPSKRIVKDYAPLPTTKRSILERLHDFLNQFLTGGYNGIVLKKYFHFFFYDIPISFRVFDPNIDWYTLQCWCSQLSGILRRSIMQYKPVMCLCSFTLPSLLHLFNIINVSWQRWDTILLRHVHDSPSVAYFVASLFPFSQKEWMVKANLCF